MNADVLTIRIRHADPALSLGLQVIFSHRVDWVVTSDGADGPIPSASGLLVVDYGTGMALTRWHAVSVPILIVTHRDTEWDVRSALAAGVRGYVLQSCVPEELVVAVERVAGGQLYLCKSMARHAAANAQRRDLTGREADVLQLIAAGDCNKVIATRLGIEVETVKSHVKGLLGKLGARTRTHAVAVAAERGLVLRNTGASGADCSAGPA